MKILIKNYNIKWLSENLLGKKGIFTSDCNLFPNFKVECKIKSIEIRKYTNLFLV